MPLINGFPASAGMTAEQKPGMKSVMSSRKVTKKTATVFTIRNGRSGLFVGKGTFMQNVLGIFCTNVQFFIGTFPGFPSALG